MKKIGYIEQGINLDHIPHGNALFVMQILNLFNSDSQTGVGLNLPSKKCGRKDLIKIENRVLTINEINAISLFCIGSTLSIINNFKVAKKLTLTLPEQINDIIVCPNERCVSDEYSSRFMTSVNRQQKTSLKCYFCEKTFLLEEIQKYNIYTR